MKAPILKTGKAPRPITTTQLRAKIEARLLAADEELKGADITSAVPAQAVLELMHDIRQILKLKHL